MHFTLFVMALTTPEEIARARETFAACRDICDRMYPAAPPSVTVTGVGAFGKNVLWAGARPDHEVQLDALASSIYERFAAAGLVKDAWSKLTAHATLAKIKFAKHSRKLKILRESWAEDTALEFGTQVFPCVELVEMSVVDPDGYYRRAESLYFNGHESVQYARGVPNPFPDLPPPPAPTTGAAGSAEEDEAAEACAAMDVASEAGGARGVEVEAAVTGTLSSIVAAGLKTVS